MFGLWSRGNSWSRRFRGKKGLWKKDKRKKNKHREYEVIILNYVRHHEHAVSEGATRDIVDTAR